MSADEEDLFVKAQANAPLNPDGSFAEERVLVRTKGGEPEYIPGVDVDYMDVSARQMVSAATALIPFLEHDDANRALAGGTLQIAASATPTNTTVISFRPMAPPLLGV